MWRTLSLFIVAGLVIFGLYSWLGNSGPASQQLSQEQLFDLIKEGRVLSIYNEVDPGSPSVT